MATLRISGFPVGISLQPALTVNGTELLPADQTVGGILQTVNVSIAQLLGGATAINYATGALTVGSASLATPLTVGGAATSGGVTLTISNTSTLSGDIARWQVSTPSSAVAMFAAPTAQSVALVTNGPTGAQTVLRNLGAYPLVFATNNTFAGSIGSTGLWTWQANGAGNHVINSQNGASDTLALNAPSGRFTSLLFNNAGTIKAQVFWDGTNAAFVLGSNTAGGATAIRSGNGVNAITIDANGAATVAAPGAASTTLTVNGFGAATFAATLNAGSASMANAILFLNGGASSAGIETIRMDKCATTGAAVPTLASNKPGGNSSTAKWIPISLDGVRHYVPAWT